ncbi:sensor histidine kinase [Niabella ginsengisoli]|uniref:Histidine kinase n=1 Tax=Niabella ginsengisoli TaxID=522298 RepID=A0ABS9SQA9_9BACT|nr:histidine kinase [Niabella ginsengisoli]MCH5600552.1 histidine kinase [Niabella ginsengisoli]
MLEVAVTDQHSNFTQKALTIKILAKWWETTAAKILFGIAAAGLLVLLVLYVVRYYKSKELKRQEAVQKIKRLELQALRSQMNPHFVHNSLNAIQYYIQRHEVELSENYLSNFSKLIRLFFEYSRRQSISIKEEIGLLDHYLKIEKLRFEDKISYQIKVDEKLDIEEQLIPTMILQPIVENAVNHGIFHKKENGSIVLDFRFLSKNSYRIIIEDDGIGIKKSKEMYKKSAKNYQSRSSAVLEERLKLLKESGAWEIDFSIKDRADIDALQTGTLINLVITKPCS